MRHKRLICLILLLTIICGVYNPAVFAATGDGFTIQTVGNSDKVLSYNIGQNSFQYIISTSGPSSSKPYTTDELSAAVAAGSNNQIPMITGSLEEYVETCKPLLEDSSSLGAVSALPLNTLHIRLAIFGYGVSTPIPQNLTDINSQSLNELIEATVGKTVGCNSLTGSFESRFASWFENGDTAGILDRSNLSSLYANFAGSDSTINQSVTNIESLPVSRWSQIALQDTILDYVSLATKERKEMNERLAANTGLDDTQLNLLKISKIVNDSFGTIYPVIAKLYDYKPSSEKSLRELCEENNINNPVVSTVVDGDFEVSKITDYPISKFYTIENNQAFASIDKEAVTDDTAAVGVASSAGDLEHIASTFKDVTLSDYMEEGLAYSATYVPMKTNLYSPDTIAQYNEEFRDEFFYKYGFMRKALYRDKSSTAVMDYYNAKGRFTGVKEVCTLRDILESNGDDVALYIDDSFYNDHLVLEDIRSDRDNSVVGLSELSSELRDYYGAWRAAQLSDTKENFIARVSNISISMQNALASLVGGEANPNTSAVSDDATELVNEIKSEYNYDISRINSILSISDEAKRLDKAKNYTEKVDIDEHMLKSGGYHSYDPRISESLGMVENSNFVGKGGTVYLNDDNYDNIVMRSSDIYNYLTCLREYQTESTTNETTTITKYQRYADYTPMLSYAYVSALYRDANMLTLANLVSSDTPVFLASDDMVSITDSSPWYKNTILNYALVQNLQSAVQIDYNYVVDLDCPLYIDIFGNISTESGIVVIPAASNATYHVGDYSDNNFAAGLYTLYGRDYMVSAQNIGAGETMSPFFVVDESMRYYVINGTSVRIGAASVKYDEISPYDKTSQQAIMLAYRSYISADNHTKLNWPILINVINEVMRGAPMENIDKEAEGLYVIQNKNRAAIVAAVKLEELITSLKGKMENTLIAIPDFSRMEETEYLVAFCIKMVMVATIIVVIIAIYRDGVAGTLGIRTIFTCIWSVILTVTAICVIPAVFHLTYYTANKFLLQNECSRILMFNLEKYNSDAEIGMLDTTTPEPTNDMSIQLDWISVPWYDQVEYMLYFSTLDDVRRVREDAIKQSVVAGNEDVEVYNDGVYVTCDTLFHSVGIDYTFSTNYVDTGDVPNYLYAYSDGNDVQTASFYSPYYVFIQVLLNNINDYNTMHNSYNYTTKYMSGNRLKTVGLCQKYFTSANFMEDAADIMRLYDIYGTGNVNEYDVYQIFDDATRATFQASLWYNDLDSNGFNKRVELMNSYARDYVAKNRDMLDKVTDETFIKVMALNMAIRYNQIFGISSANALEIYNMDSNDLLRLSIVPTDQAIAASPMSYARFVYNFGGEPSVYAAAVLEMIMWLGSFIKPLCTIIVFLSVFLSIFVFKVVLRKPSTNIVGLIVTVLALCFTNVLHAILLKVSTYLPDIGLSCLGCLLFLIFAQVLYLLLLSYVTGTSLKDWQNLGATEYEKNAKALAAKFRSKNTSDNLRGDIPHHEDGMEYYNDLVKRHRMRNGGMPSDGTRVSKIPHIHEPAKKAAAAATVAGATGAVGASRRQRHSMQQTQQPVSFEQDTTQETKQRGRRARQKDVPQNSEEQEVQELTDVLNTPNRRRGNSQESEPEPIVDEPRHDFEQDTSQEPTSEPELDIPGVSKGDIFDSDSDNTFESRHSPDDYIPQRNAY